MTQGSYARLEAMKVGDRSVLVLAGSPGPSLGQAVDHHQRIVE